MSGTCNTHVVLSGCSKKDRMGNGTETSLARPAYVTLGAVSMGDSEFKEPRTENFLPSGARTVDTLLCSVKVVHRYKVIQYSRWIE